MSFWKARSSVGGWVGIGLMVIVLVTVGMLVTLLFSSPINLLSFCLGLLALASAVVLVVLAYWTYGYYTLYYTLDRDALRIRWTGFETTVPVSDIRGVIAGETDKGGTWLPFLRWPGYCIGRGRVRDIGEVMYYTAGTNEYQLLVRTDTVSYMISPADPEGFQQALELRQFLGPVHEVAPQVTASRMLGRPFWTDGLVHRLGGVALMLNLGLLAYLCAIYPNLTPVLPVHFDAFDQVNRIAPAIAVFFLPAIGALSLLLNGLVGYLIHSRHRLATLLLWGGTSAVQIYLWVAALGITFHGGGT
jgi:hypothetical protein